MEVIKEYIKRKKLEVAEELKKYSNLAIAIVQVGHVPASDRYVKNKIKDCEEVGLSCSLVSLPENITEDELLYEIFKLNNNPNIKGFIVQMPLPRGISEEKVKLAVSPEKDIDGFNVLNNKCFAATPSGIMTYLKDMHYDFESKNAVIIGRSNIVGKPMHNLLLKANMNVINLHTKTTAEDKKFYLEHADLIVVATGHRHSLTKEYNLKESAIVFDVGINIKEDGKLCGDCDYDDLFGRVEFISPCPGGVGLLTRLQLIINLLEICK